MFNLSFTACSFKFMKPHSKKKEYAYLNLPISVSEGDNIVEYSIVDVFENFFLDNIERINDDNKKKSFHCIYNKACVGEDENFKYLSCLIKSGSYGSATDVVDNESNKTVYKVKPNQTLEKTFNLYIVIPKDNNKVKVQRGMMFFLNIGQFGVKMITTDNMKKFISNKYNLTFSCDSIAPRLFVDRMLKLENVKKMVMTKFHKSADDSDLLHKGYGVESKIIGDLSYDASAWSKMIEKIKDCMAGKYNLFEFANVEYDKLKVVVDIGGRQRVVDVHNIENMSIIEAIPDEVMASDGYPNIEKLHTHFLKVANEYLNEMVTQIN